MTHLPKHLEEKMRDKLSDRVFNDFFHKLTVDKDKMRLKATLSKAGFEYKIHGATVEVSPDSIAELLLGMVNPSLQDSIDKALSNADGESRTVKRSQGQK